MGELGIDISNQHSKTLDQYIDRKFDEVITVCDDANEGCPIFPGAKTDDTGVFLILRKQLGQKKNN